MVTYVVGYCAIHDYDFSQLVYSEGVESSGGGAAVEEITITGRNYGDVRAKGRQPKRYKIKARAWDREEIEIFLRTCNTLPVDAEFFPFDAERIGSIASAHASLQPVKKWGTGQNFYEVVAEIGCREAWLCGADQGIDFKWWEPLPSVSALLTNAGHERAPISYMQCSGDYAGGYVEDLSVRITPASTTGQKDRELALCEKMLRADLFELGWRGEARHTYEQDFGKSLTEISIDLHGLVSGGVWSANRCCLSAGEYLMVPFYGPLPVSGDAGAVSLQLDIEAIGGGTDERGGAIHVAEEIDLLDVAEVDHDGLVVGENNIPVPDMEGKGLVCVGIYADADTFAPFAGPTFGNCLDIAVAADGSIYVVSDLYELWHWDATNGWLLDSTTPITAISISSSGALFGLTAGQEIKQWLGGDSWSAVIGAGVTSFCVYTDLIMLAVAAGVIFSTVDGGANWTNTATPAEMVSVTADGVRLAIASGIAYAFVAGAWVPLSGSSITDIAATSTTNVYVISGGVVWNLRGTTWTAVAGTSGMSNIDISREGILAGSTTSATVWQRPYILLSGLKAVVNRYIAPTKIPWSDPDETFKIRVESSNGNRLRFLQACWQNRYWY